MISLKKPIFLSQLSKKQLISLFSFLIITICLPLTILLVKQQQSYQGRAVGPEARPTNVKITNLHGGGFSVSWTSVNPTTENFQETTGSVLWGTDQNNLTQEMFDDRGQDISSANHHIPIVNLNPNNVYYFEIKSGPDLYGKHPTEDSWVKGGAVAQRTTPVELALTGNPQPIYGYIKNQAGDKVSGALVYAYLKKDDSQTKSALISTVTKDNEGWVMDAKNARTEDLTSFFSFDNNDRVLIQAQAAEKGIATADFAVTECSPAPEIILIPQVISTPTPTTEPTTGPTPTLSPTATPTLTPTPTSTPMPTPTQAPNTANLNFQIKFQGINQQRPDKTAKITIIKEGNLVATYDNIGVNADQNGIYSGRLMNIPPGTYALYIKGWAHLQKKFENVTLNAGENSQDWSADPFRAGDINSDNYVSGADFGILQSAYFEPGPADLNLDGAVNGADFAIMQPNYFECGDSAPGEQSKCE